ncbi:uncharacterized protein LAESUDRAFT_347646 [Laetiporus sulphureus 93-53]|uniref:DUF6534 domain-containing protein n=1 Tax=Laetiporus sulphureus 93-53 TaxID=1314785 RepID=A0A165GSJ7_9APHY|nr:uncharacterized protein LAESUDRAFT_347646 [Laetiporus sulphureus 93-53]KZT10749.1 hypothetical protein LAESUDRAFT_347646 [Laetiporus sulphureus 93-53]
MTSLAGTFGTNLVGVFATAILFGVTNLQVFIYYQQYGSDPKWLKISVFLLWLIDAAHLALSFHILWWYFVVHDAWDPSVFSSVVWSYNAEEILCAICVSFVHTLFLVRVWRLCSSLHPCSRRWTIVPIVASSSVLAGYAATLEACFELGKTANHVSPAYLLDTKWLTYVPLSIWAGADTFIAISLILLLMYTRTGVKQTETMVSTLIIYILSTGMLTGFCSIMAIIMMATLPQTFAVSAFEIPLMSSRSIVLASLSLHFASDRPSASIGPLDNLGRIDSISREDVKPANAVAAGELCIM